MSLIPPMVFKFSGVCSLTSFRLPQEILAYLYSARQEESNRTCHMFRAWVPYIIPTPFVYIGNSFVTIHREFVNLISLYKLAPLTSSDIERSFLKSVLSDNRMRYNFEKQLICVYNSKND